jgi:hypothetical protein
MRRSKRELVEESSGKVPALKMMHSCDDGDREREKERRRGERIENRETQNCFVEVDLDLLTAHISRATPWKW